MMAEPEERHELWGQPGKIKLTGFLSRGSAGQFSDAVALSQLTYAGRHQRCPFLHQPAWHQRQSRHRPFVAGGVAGVLNGISSQHVAFFGAGGLGILVGDGQLPKSGLEKIIEA
jgi:high affinity Mn2+ porin